MQSCEITGFMGLTKNITFYGLTAMATNTDKVAKNLGEMCLPEVELTGYACLN